MSNIIEQQFKLNMKTETKKKRTPNTPLMADCMCKASPSFGLHGTPSFSSFSGCTRWMNGYGRM